MNFSPDYCVPTGEYITEWMEDEGINASELARRLDVSPKHVSKLLSGEASLTPDIALSLEKATGVPASIWNQYESQYQEDLSRQKEKALLETELYPAAKQYPIAYLRKYGIITAGTRDKSGIVSQLLSFFGVANFEALAHTWQESSLQYRRIAYNQEKHAELQTWLQLGEYKLDVNAYPEYDKQKLNEILTQLPKFTNLKTEEGLRQAINELGKCGVIVRITPAIQGLRIHGVTRWHKKRPLIQLSLLYKTNDQIWFTLFHELAHVVLHDHRNLYINQNSQDQQEQEANHFASYLLIPEEYQDKLHTVQTISMVKAIAKELNIHPGILVGQVQKKTNRFNWGNQLKEKVEVEKWSVAIEHELSTNFRSSVVNL